MRRRILHVVTGFDAAGTERFLARLAGRMPADRWLQRVVGLGPHGPAGTEIRGHGIDVEALGIRSWTGVPRAAFRLASTARAFRPDLVHGWMYHGNLGALWAARVAPSRPPLLWGVRQGLYDRNESPRRTRAAIRLGARLSGAPTRILYNSAAAARQHENAGFRAAATRIVPNGVDVDAFTRSPDTRAKVRAELGLAMDEEVLAFPARWHPVKDHRSFARAARGLMGRRPRARFVLFGRGIVAENAALEALLEEQGVRDRCLLLGERTDVADLLYAADVAILTSRGEAFPNALAEAMAAGVPCIGTSVGDTAELIGESGIVVAPRDTVAMCAAWDAVLSLDPPRREAMGRSARERIRHRFSLDRSVAELEAVYSEVLEA